MLANRYATWNQRFNLKMDKTSRFRPLFLIREFIFFVILTTVIVLSIYFSVYVVSAFLLFFFISGISNAFSLARVKVKNDGIEIAAFLTRQKLFFTYADVNDVKVGRSKWHDHKGGILRGETNCTITLKNKRELIFSADEFENFNEIVTAIRTKLDQSTSHNSKHKKLPLFA
jgi:hypothetical protein